MTAVVIRTDNRLLTYANSHIPQSNISSQSTDVVNICAPDFQKYSVIEHGEWAEHVVFR